MSSVKKINYSLNDYDLKLLPHDLKLERMILGLFLDIPNLIEQMNKYLSIEGIFYNTQNNSVWEAILKVISFKMIPNKENVVGYFTRKGEKDNADYTNILPIHAGQVFMIKQYCLKLNEVAITRNLIRLGYDLNQKGYAQNDALDLLSQASNGIGKLYEHIAGMKAKTLADGIDDLAQELVDIANSPDGMLGIKGTIPSLNQIFKGYRRGNMIVIGASSGEGKSTFMLQEVNFIASSGLPVGIVSLEMTQAELLLKICCERLNLDIDAALSGRLSADDLSKVSDELSKIKKLPLYISETPAMKIGEIKAMARMWKNRNKIKILFIDHMHLANSDFQHSNSEQKFTDIANQIKEIAKELDIPVVSLAQLARKDNLTEKRMHVMTDLKYAGGIEQAADVIIMIFRPEEHGIEEDSDGNSTKGKAIIKVEKLRLLRKGSVKCEFNGLRFTDINNSNNWGGYKAPEKVTNTFQEDNPF